MSSSSTGHHALQSNATTTTANAGPNNSSNNSASTRSMLSVNLEAAAMANDPLRDLFEACKTGDLVKVKKLITSQTVNARDTAGRKSTPLHFAAGKLNDTLLLVLYRFVHNQHERRGWCYADGN